MLTVIMAAQILQISYGVFYITMIWCKRDKIPLLTLGGYVSSPSCHRYAIYMSLQWRNNGCDGVSNHQPLACLLNRLFRRRSKKTSKFRVTDLCKGNLLVIGEFPAQMASNAENIAIWWRHIGWDAVPFLYVRSTWPLSAFYDSCWEFVPMGFKMWKFHVALYKQFKCALSGTRFCHIEMCKKWNDHRQQVQWNLSVTTTSIINFFTCDLVSYVF